MPNGFRIPPRQPPSGTAPRKRPRASPPGRRVGPAPGGPGRRVGPRQQPSIPRMAPSPYAIPPYTPPTGTVPTGERPGAVSPYLDIVKGFLQPPTRGASPVSGVGLPSPLSPQVPDLRRRALLMRILGGQR